MVRTNIVISYKNLQKNDESASLFRTPVFALACRGIIELAWGEGCRFHMRCIQRWKPKKDKVRTYISGDICPHDVRTMSAQHLTKDICLTGEMLCGHSAEIVRTYISRDICPHYILLRFSALELDELTLPYSHLLIALLIVKHSFESSCPSLDWSVGLS